MKAITREQPLTGAKTSPTWTSKSVSTEDGPGPELLEDGHRRERFARMSQSLIQGLGSKIHLFDHEPSRGSADYVRHVQGFTVQFYPEAGKCDMVRK